MALTLGLVLMELPLLLALMPLNSRTKPFGKIQARTLSSSDVLDIYQITAGGKVISEGLKGTVDSITDTTVTLTEKVEGWVNGENVTGPVPDAVEGTVDSVNDTTISLTDTVSGWIDGVNVAGPEKTIVEENARKYLVFGQDSVITDLRDTPQDLPYTTVDHYT